MQARERHGAAMTRVWDETFLLILGRVLDYDPSQAIIQGIVSG